MDRNRRILDAAAELFYEKGFHGTSVDELGTRAGVSGPAVYRHFAGKDEILAALFDEAMDILLAAVEPIHDGAGDDLERLIRHHVEFAIGNRHLVNVSQREDRSLVQPFKRRVDRRRKKYVEGWEAAVGRYLPDATSTQVSVVTQTCLGMIFSISYWPTSATKSSTLTDSVVAIALGGVDAAGR
ncbi:TetR/AcrR family transcriptional regulator [Rhodococcoides kyotonense]|uniref:DNA-binding transcriptional regulator, AcrR family n=1 Tax=Rhodococcoides kyotonense TaxID=398843 RepID=A0A239K2V1_9NOCA|nr:TetR/AcrR family transcriptional regulator [Rhodococcus kyotonensis]SNT11434.1 DNA-binding transcriptional regulator, AcrR family [Rhodococcus kyotonensis]